MSGNVILGDVDAVRVADVQRMGGVAAVVDAGHVVDLRALAMAGVRVDELLVCQPDDAAQALHVAAVLQRCGAMDAIWVTLPADTSPRLA